MKKMMNHAATGMMVASLVEEIGGATHGGAWKLSYYDNKFSLVANNMAIINEEVKTVAQ